MPEGRGKILVVDDERSVREVLSEFLTELGYEVVDAGSGTEALSRLGRDRPDAVLLDIRMPELDGVQTLRRIRELNTTLPVLMITGNDDAEVAKETIRLGAFDCLAKPFDFDYLDRVLHKVLADRVDGRPTGVTVAEPSPYGLAYDLALEIFRATARMSPRAHVTLGTALEAAALHLARRGSGAEKGEIVRALNQVRVLIRFGRDLGEFSDDGHRRLESYVVKARRSIGLT
jgi:CheY-like chemotaxis protein